MTIAECFAECLADDYVYAITYGGEHWDLIEFRMGQLRSGKFECDFRFLGLEGPVMVTTGEVISALCNFGETELVAYVLQDLHEHGVDIDTEEEL